MVVFSYNLSLGIRELLNKADSLRVKLLLTPLSFKEELKFRWRIALEKTYFGFYLNEEKINKREIEKIFLFDHKKLNTELIKGITGYKRNLDLIFLEWLCNTRPVTTKVILKLYDNFCTGNLRVSEKELKQNLDYLQIKTEHPVVQAGLAYIFLFSLSPFTKNSELMALLVAYIFLYKGGFDTRAFLVFEEYWLKEYGEYKEVLAKVLETRNVTLFLEFFARGVIYTLEKTLKEISSGEKIALGSSGKLFDLTDRQKEILSYLETPEATINNRKVQSLFKVSQITASRDLRGLVALGLLLSHGRGRSVYYTKV